MIGVGVRRVSPAPRIHVIRGAKNKEDYQMKRVWKTLALVLALAMMLSLAACGGGNNKAPANNDTQKTDEPATNDAPSTPDPAPSGEKKTYNIGVSIYQFNDNFMTLYRNELESYFKELNSDSVEYKVNIQDGKNDMAEQTNQIQNFITQGMDLIICNPVQTSSADTLIDLAVDAGIPMVLINREPLGVDADGNTVDESYPGIVDNPTVCYVGADARQSGTYQGEIVAALDNKGDMNGDGKVSYVMIIGDPENPDAQYRTEFSIKALTDAGVEVEELTAQIGNWDTNQGQQIAQNALNQFGDQIDVIFCNNDGMALGAAAAIEQAGRKVGEDILLLGVDALEECQQMVQNGTMTGTVLNDHIGQSHKAVDVAVQALNGESIDNYYWVDYVKVDASYFA